MRRNFIGLATAGVIMLGAWAVPVEASSPSGDVNGDCVVNSADLRIVAERFGATFGSLRYVREWDFNNDGRIGVADLQVVASQFGQRCA